MEAMQVKGRSYVENRTGYQLDDYERMSSTKQEQRDIIQSFILDNLDCSINYTGLAGKYWNFERDLIKNAGETVRLSSFEKNPQIYHNTKFMMCGNHRVISKSKNITPNIKLDIHVNDKSVYVLGGINDLTEKNMHRLLCDISGTFKFGFTRRNAIWYDFTSSFNEETFKSIHNIRNIVKKNAKSIVCLTFLYGRDQYFNGSSEESRIEIIKAALPEFEPVKYWKYKGFNEATMLNVCGVINHVM